MNKDIRICILGAGHLGTSLIKLLVQRGHKNIIATRRDIEKLKELQELFPDIKTTTDNQAAVKVSDIIILVTKQTSFEGLAEEINDSRKDKLLISAGPTYTLKKLKGLFGKRNIRIITPVDPAEDVICYAIDTNCTSEDEKILEIIFGKNVKKVPENQMPIATSYTLFRGVLNSFVDPLCKAGVEAGLPESLARQILGRMLISTGKEIEEGMKAKNRLESASGGFNESSFTLKLYKQMEPAQKQLETLFKKTCEGFKKAETDS